MKTKKSKIVTFFVPVIDKNGKPLMPTILSRAKKWIASRRATPFWSMGVYCIRLNDKTLEECEGEPVVGLDTGSKKEAYTVKSTFHTYLNIQADAVDFVEDKVEARKNARRTRRYRKTPYRKPRFNRNRNKSFLPPSTRARWQWKLRIFNWLKKIFPIAGYVIEDVKAVSKKGQRKWNKSFNPLQVGKHWFYEQIDNPATREGWQTAELRDMLGLSKSKNKLSDNFDAHCVDSWVLANSIVRGHVKPDNKMILYLTPFNFPRRQLHVFKPAKGGKRKRYGGTRSCGFKKGDLIKHPKVGLAYVGGHDGKGRITLYDLKTGNRFGQSFKPSDCKFLRHCNWRFR